MDDSERFMYLCILFALTFGIIGMLILLFFIVRDLIASFKDNRNDNLK